MTFNLSAIAREERSKQYANLYQINNTKLINRTFIITLLFSITSFLTVKADVGETYDLKNKRDEIIQKITVNDSLIKNSEAELEQAILNYKTVVDLDNQIFSSYQGTVYRTANHEYKQKLGNRLVVNIAFILSIALILVFIIMYRQNKLLKYYTGNNYTLLSVIKEVFVLSTPLFQKNQEGHKVNKLLYISILVMAIFVFIGLLSQI